MRIGEKVKKKNESLNSVNPIDDTKLHECIYVS